MDWAEAIRAATARISDDPYLARKDPTLPDDLAAYVLEGTDPAVLDRVGYEESSALGINQYQPATDHPVRDFYAAFREVPPDVLIRWGLAIHASAGRHLHTLHVDKVYWPGTMLAQVGIVYPDGELPFGFSDFAALLNTAEVHSGKFLVHAWHIEILSWARLRPGLVLARLDGYAHAVAQLHQWLAPWLVEGDVDHRLHALDMVAPVDDSTLAMYAEQLAEAAVSGSTQVREHAAPLVARLGPTGSEQLRRIALAAKPEQRRLALRLLWDTAPDEEQRTFARDTALADRAASVRTVADGFTHSARPDAVPVPDVPQAAPIEWAVEWTDDLAAALTAYVAEVRHWSPAREPGNTYTPLAPDEVLETFREQLTSPEPVAAPYFLRNYQFTRSTTVRDALERGVLSTPAVVKLLVSGDQLSNDYASYHDLRWAAQLLHEHRGLTLLDLAAHLEDVPGLDDVEMVARGWFHNEAGGLGRDWDPAAVWPFFARHLDGVLAYWQRRRTGHSYGFDSEAIFPLVATFPEPPTRLVDLCYDLALGSAKSDQRAAQDFLTTHPDAVRRATAALSDGNGIVRAVAADWLGRIGDRGAVPTLAAAFATEKNETVQGALLEALVALGETLEEHFDLAAVDAQAAKAMAKGPPAALAWLDPQALPDVRRASGSDVVPRDTMLWLVARAVTAKSSIPGALLRACVHQLRPEDAERFADALLRAWIALDEESVGRTSYGSVVKAGTTTGAASRGLLAVVAAAGGAGSVADAVRYVRQWHGQRATLSKALVTMLAHHRDPAAIEAVVAIAYRFKAPSIERAAREEVAALAARLGWTTDQLADRTVSTAGFDDAGSMALSYGDRSFTARLLPDCGIELLDTDGKARKALPAARQSDDAEAAKEARKSLAAAKKQLVETVKIQTVRLHDAMCAQRAWTAGDWRHDLAGHPVLARLVARLVWVAETGDARLTFRLLDDGTLTDVADEPVTLPDDAAVRIAHDVTLTDAELEGWQQHLTDYEVPSLFWQLGRGRPGLTDEQAAATELDAGRVGVATGRLGQVTTRLGYRRGQVGDGAAYDWFEKEFASLGLRALLMIEAQGIEDHESETTVESLVVEAAATGQRVPLGELPPVLLVELQHDLAVAVGT